MEIKIADEKDIDTLMEIRLTMLRQVNGMADSDTFSEELTEHSRRYFQEGDQTTALALEDGKPVACASISYIEIMPTFDHPTGRRAHLMNVYTDPAFRRRGIAQELCELLIEDAKKKGATEISLDATESGRPLYEALGFKASSECMVMTI